MSKDLVLLVADKNMEGALKGLLSRPTALGIKSLSFDLYVHPERDPGCFLRSHEFLKHSVDRYSYAIVLFDREGSGQEAIGRLSLESQVEERLQETGWSGRAVAVAIDPELEIWVWSDSPNVEIVLGWERSSTPLRSWLKEQGLWREGEIKPGKAKQAVDEALRRARKPRSSALYFQLAQRVSTDRCVDPSFQKLRDHLKTWFAEGAAA